jgi:hypothetical protein
MEENSAESRWNTIATTDTGGDENGRKPGVINKSSDGMDMWFHLLIS